MEWKAVDFDYGVPVKEGNGALWAKAGGIDKDPGLPLQLKQRDHTLPKTSTRRIRR